jgi:YjbE family integral membrane protein
VLSIVMVDLTLSGDNAVVIAAAVKPLPAPIRRRALMAGAGCAIVVMVISAVVATRLLHIELLQLIGGAAILWIAAGLFREEPPLESSAKQAPGFWRAMWFIIVADVTMSTDNVLAVAAIAQGNVLLLIFGLSLSIPIIIFASSMLARVMEEWPIVVWVGAALLGRVAGQMIVSDAFVVRRFSPSAPMSYLAQAGGTALVLLVGWWLRKGRPEKTA